MSLLYDKLVDKMPYACEQRYKVRNHEVATNLNITIPALLILMQDASMVNAKQLKLSIWDMKDIHGSWVLLRKRIKVIRRPKLDEELIVFTYPSGFDRVFAYRDFWVFNANTKELLAQAASTWSLMNLNTRKVMRVPESFLDKIPNDRSICLPILPSRIPSVVETHVEKQYEVSYYDLDWNDHVNNVVLTKLMIQVTPYSKLQTFQIQEFSFHIKSECLMNERLTIQYEEKNDQDSLHKIIGSDDRIVAIGTSKWA